MNEEVNCYAFKQCKQYVYFTFSLPLSNFAWKCQQSHKGHNSHNPRDKGQHHAEIFHTTGTDIPKGKAMLNITTLIYCHILSDLTTDNFSQITGIFIIWTE
jgi:hypothetical protein